VVGVYDINSGYTGMIEALGTAMPFPYPKIIAHAIERCNYRPMNFRETAPRRVLNVGNINSYATGFDINPWWWIW